MPIFRTFDLAGRPGRPVPARLPNQARSGSPAQPAARFSPCELLTEIGVRLGEPALLGARRGSRTLTTFRSPRSEHGMSTIPSPGQCHRRFPPSQRRDALVAFGLQLDAG